MIKKRKNKQCKECIKRKSEFKNNNMNLYCPVCKCEKSTNQVKVDNSDSYVGTRIRDNRDCMLYKTTISCRACNFILYEKRREMYE